ncbi:MAG: cupredoxin domain-containing protein [Anaerolineae bacterium]|nr:cupredoxin domain-containing protein [Anaerolineae bacterium]
MKKPDTTPRDGRKPHAVRRSRDNRLRVLGFSVIVIFVIGAAGYLFVSALLPKTLVAAENTIDVAADMSGFSLGEIRVTAGEALTLRLTSLDTQFHTDGGGQHQWAVEELNVSVIAPPKGSNSITFTPDRPGTYTFYCDICCGGRANPSMQGTLIVEEA